MDYRIFKCRVSAKDMTQMISARFFTGDEGGAIYTFTVRDYAEYLIEHSSDKRFEGASDLAKALLNYGTAAQRYFNIKTDDLANDNLPINERLMMRSVTAEEINAPYDINGTDLPQGVTFEGTSLSLKSDTTLSLYFKCDKTLVFSCDGMTVDTDITSEYQVARIRGIKPQNLKDQITLTVGSGDMTGTIKYCPLTYCYNILSDDTQSADLQNVCRALYMYYSEAVRYFGQNNG